MHFSALGREIHYETTAARKVTVKPLQEQFDSLSIIDIFFFASEIRTCVAEVSSLSELNTLPTKLSGRPRVELFIDIIPILLVNTVSNIDFQNIRFSNDCQ